MSDQNPSNNDPFNNDFEQDPFIEDHFGNRSQTSSTYSGSGGHHAPQSLPESTAVLVLGILSIVGSFCYGVPGLILGIIAVAMSVKPERLYRADPSRYDTSSYNTMRAGKICGIVGLCLSVLLGVVMIVIILNALNESNVYY